jgi:hypothetical protein
MCGVWRTHPAPVLALACQHLQERERAGFGSRISGLGFRISSFGFRVSGSGVSGFRVSGIGVSEIRGRVSVFWFRFSDRMFWVWGFGFQGFGFQVSGFSFRISGFEFRVSGFGVSGFRVSGFEFPGFKFRVWVWGAESFGCRVPGFDFRFSGLGFTSCRHPPSMYSSTMTWFGIDGWGLVFEAHRLLYHSASGSRTFCDL